MARGVRVTKYLQDDYILENSMKVPRILEVHIFRNGLWSRPKDLKTVFTSNQGSKQAKSLDKGYQAEHLSYRRLD